MKMNKMNQNQKLFKQEFIDRCQRDLINGQLSDLYKSDLFKFNNTDVLENKRIPLNDNPELLIPEKDNFFEYENAIKIFQAYKDIDRTQATDTRIWTYLAHITYWKYMKARWPIPENESSEKTITFILQHWYMKSSDSKSISRHGIASLWWGTFITYDKNRTDPFELTREFFSKQDYKRVIFEENICFYKPLVQAILEYVIENKEIFEKYWAYRIRFLIRKLNFISGYKVLSSLDKTKIKSIINEYKRDIASVTPEITI